MKIAKIVYINLDRRKDRRAWIEEELDNMMPDIERERFVAVDIPRRGIGCAQSHLEVIKRARTEKLPNVLVMEDDFTFLITKKEWEEDLARLAHVSFDVCMLGYNLIRGEPCSEHSFLTKVLNAQTASAYLIQESMYDRLIKVWESTLPLLRSTHDVGLYASDVTWKLLQPSSDWYCFTRRVGKQRACYSDNGENENKFIDYGC